MTFKQLLGCAIVSSFLMGMGFCGIARAESQPVSLEGRALKIEMDAYIDKFTDEVGITDEYSQWAVMVLPVLELAGPAAVYGWLVPPVKRHVPGEPRVWITLFTFHEKLMLELPPMMRRVVAGHEVAHMMDRCHFEEPNFEGLDRFEAAWLMFTSTVVKESCADIVSSELTSPEDVLATLHFLKDQRPDGNAIIIRRIQMMARIIEREAQNHE